MNILIIEDNVDHQDLLVEALTWSQESNICVVNDLASGIAQLSKGGFDICLSDLNLPDSPSQDTIEWLRRASDMLPIVVLTSIDDLALAQTIIHAGIQDYISKDEISASLLQRTCLYAIERWKHQLTVKRHNAEMESFCQSLAHDFNGHIAKIIGLADILKIDFETMLALSPNQKDLFSSLSDSTANLYHLSANLQHYFSLGIKETQFRPVSLQEQIELARQYLQKYTNKPFSLKLNGTDIEVNGDPAMLKLLFVHIFSNAIQFNTSDALIDVAVTTNEHSYTLRIQDNGIGIDASHIATIFEPFTRLSSNSVKDKFGEGSGLGLSIVKKIVDIHDGQIQLSSIKGEGTHVSIVLPL